MSITEAKNYAAPRPTKTTLFLRSFLPWQLVRFVIINLKMSVMIIKSHGRAIEPIKNKGYANENK
jgi:hypothetical protein